MAAGSFQLRDYPTELVRLSCEKCGRSGQYRKQKLIKRYGADMRLPDLREEIAQCERMTPAWCVTLILCAHKVQNRLTCPHRVRGNSATLNLSYRDQRDKNNSFQ